MAIERSRHEVQAAGFNALLVCMGLLCLSGCTGEPDWPTVPVTGTVKAGSSPLADAVIFFSPIDGTSGRYSVGATDAEGRYTLKASFGRDATRPGAVPGTYRVGFSKCVDAQGKPIVDDGKSKYNPLAQARDIIPRKYWVMESDLRATVTKAGPNVHDFTIEEIKAPAAIPSGMVRPLIP